MEKKWITISEYVDIDTGEIITKSMMEREYVKIRKPFKKIEENEKYRIIKYVHECERNRQQKLF